MIKLFILQLIAHLLADFIFQPHKWSQQKGQKAISKTHYVHALIVFLFAYILSFDWQFIFGALTIAVVHFFIDVAKSSILIRKNDDKNTARYFFWDQLLHVIVILIICWGHKTQFGINYIIEFSLETTVIASAFVFCAKPANIFIKHILIYFGVSIPENGSNNEETNFDLPNAGRLIGIMERFLALALVLMGQYIAIAFIITGKSILRFSDNQKNEYVLTGTLLSFGLAILPGIIITKVFL